jgi:hypothetical protein
MLWNLPSPGFQVSKSSQQTNPRQPEPQPWTAPHQPLALSTWTSQPIRVNYVETLDRWYLCIRQRLLALQQNPFSIKSYLIDSTSLVEELLQPLFGPSSINTMDAAMDTAFHLLVRAVDRNGIDPNNIDVNTTDPVKIAMSRKYCHVGTCPTSWQTIKYRPTLPGNVIYMLCFLALLGAQLFLGIRTKTWSFMGTICLGLLGEVIGYIGRIMLEVNPFIENNFLL